jgi:hypothetical protein
MRGKGFGRENPYENKPLILFRPSYHRSVGVSHGEGYQRLYGQRIGRQSRKVLLRFFLGATNPSPDLPIPGLRQSSPFLFMNHSIDVDIRVLLAAHTGGGRFLIWQMNYPKLKLCAEYLFCKINVG